MRQLRATITGAYAAGTLTWESGGQYTVEAFAAAASCRNWTPDDPRRPRDNPGDELDDGCLNSFPGATGVLLADGTTKPIAEVAVGDLALALDPRTGERGPREVEAVIEGSGAKRLIALTLATGDGVAMLRATAQHPFWLATEGRWAAAEDLGPGDLLLTADGAWVRVLKADATQVPGTTVYNLTVAGLHTYFVVPVGTTSAVLVHNTMVKKCLDVAGMSFSSEKLNANLRSAGRPKPNEYSQPHHIIPGRAGASSAPCFGNTRAHWATPIWTLRPTVHGWRKNSTTAPIRPMRMR